MTTSLLDIFGDNDELGWMARPDLRCAMPADTPALDRRIEADGRWFPRDQFYDRTKSNCDGCPEMPRCLQYALDNREEFGIWGGTTPAERRTLLRKRRAA